MATSVDELDAHNQGLDGRRSIWSFVFSKMNSDIQYWIRIRYNEIEWYDFIHQGKTIEEELIFLDDIIIDSPEALNIVLDLYNLKPGKNWARGHHFNLWRGVDENGDILEGVLFGVTGFTEEGNFFRAQINLTTGEVKGYDSGSQLQ